MSELHTTPGIEDSEDGSDAVAEARGDRLVVRLGAEITQKARRTRRRFQSRLVHNISDALALAGADFSVQQQWSRFLVEIDDSRRAQVLRRVFGVNSYSPIDATVPAELDAIVERGHELYT